MFPEQNPAEMDGSSQSLRAACTDPDSLFTAPEEDLLRRIYQEFPRDIDRLRRAYSVRDSPWTPPTTRSPSCILLHDNYDEVNRTLVSFLALRWIHLGQYEVFVGSQPPETALSRQSFDWIRHFYTQVVLDADGLYTLIISIIINDLGKDPQLASDYQQATGIDIANFNHDVILLRACEAGLIRSLDKLPTQYREDVLRAIELGATFNFGQLAQAENAPACLSGLLRMKNSPRSFQFRFMEQLLDIAGAAAHMDWTCAKKLTQPIFEAYQAVYDACQSVLAGYSDLRSGYDLVLIRRAEALHRKGLPWLQVEMSSNDRALMRLLCMGNVTTLEKAQLFETTWDSLDNLTREALVRCLNVFGQRGDPAVQPTYMPAFLSRIKNKRALMCAFRYLSRIMTATDLQNESAVVIERSVLGVLKQYMESGEFDEDPTILEQIGIPEAVLTQIA